MKTNQTFELQKLDYTIFDTCGTYVSGMRLYLGLFNEIASMKKLNNIDPLKAKKWVIENYKDEISNQYEKEDYREPRKKVGFINFIYVLKSKVMIDIDYDGCINILFIPESESNAEQITKELQKFKKRIKKTAEIGLVISGISGLSVYDAAIKKPKLNIEKNYNDDLGIWHKEILKMLRKNNENGLILFHGEPGTGKSTYIRYLIHSQNKKVIFLPSGLARSLESPSLISLLVNNKNSVLVIEDAEDLLTSRDINLNSGVSMLLNITDGLLGECLRIQVICTFNTNISNIDKALLRKGRLKAMYEFKALAPDKANQLISDMKLDTPFTTQPMPLSELFHAKANSVSAQKSQRQQIGFLANAN